MKNRERIVFLVQLVVLQICSIACSNNAPKSFILADENLPTQKREHQDSIQHYSLPKLTATLSIFDQILFNTEITNHFKNSKFLPPIPLFIGYTKNGLLAKRPPLVAAMLDKDLFSHLPQAVKEQVEAYKDKLEIAFIVQSSQSLNENLINDGGYLVDDETRFTTRLMAHAWADPEAPAEYSGQRVNRNFLQGLFNATMDLSSKKFPMNTLKEVHVFVHDKTFSPRFGSHKVELHGDISKLEEPLAVWSVVIDNNPPSGHPQRAIATLHWLFLNHMDRHPVPGFPNRKTSDYGLLFSSLIDQNPKPKLKISDFEAFIEICSKLPFLQKSQALEMLISLFKNKI